MSKMTRTDSICPPAELLLLQNVKKNDPDKIRALVDQNKDLLTHIYPDTYKPILLIACTEDSIKPETVQVLIDLGADLYYTSEVDDEWQPLHFVASSTNSEKLKIIVDNLRPGKINELARGSNALHILITYGDRDNKEEEFLKCASILIKAGIDINQGDANNISPILWAAKKGFRDIVAAILENSVIDVDLDTHTSRGKTARQLIIEKKLYDSPLPDVTDNNNRNANDPGRVLFMYIKEGNENAFINFNEGRIESYVDMDDTSSTLLQYCCQKGLAKAARHLLNNYADPNKTVPGKNGKRPIEIAAEYGYYEIFATLLSLSRTQVSSKVLSNLIKKQNENELLQPFHMNHKQCYEILLDKLKTNRSFLDINEKDENSNTPLHYAIRYSDAETTHELLELGASLATKNKFDAMPIGDIQPSVLESHLDRCVEFDIRGKNFDKEDFAVTFNYRNLISPVKRSHKYNTNFEYSDVESEINFITQELTAETEVICYMSKAIEFRHLLKHPVIVSFLLMKWYRIRWLFWTNLIFYSIFTLSLVVYILSSFGSNEQGLSFRGFAMLSSYTILCITFVILILRELFQIAASFEKYYTNFENYIEIILIILTGCIILRNASNDDTRKQLSSLAILLAAFELVLMLGQHPMFSTNVVMLKTVSYNFFKFLSWYSLLIIAFALSFYILFTGPPKSDDILQNTTNQPLKKDEATTNDDEENGNENEDFFADPGKSVFKTIVMLTGEFDASDLNFHTYPIISKLIFIMFVFMIAIILLNLLTGLAVSDTQMIKNDAELVGLIARAQHIRYAESMLLGNFFPMPVLRFFQRICCCLNPSSDSRCIIRPLAKRACLFPNFLNYELTVYPNKGGEVHLPNTYSRRKSQQQCSWKCTKLSLDKETVKRTNAIVQSKRDEKKAENERKVQETQVVDFQKCIADIQREQNRISAKLELILSYIDDKSTRFEK